MNTFLQTCSNGEFALFVTVKPGQKKEGLFESSEGDLCLRVKGRPLEGEANSSVVEYLSKVLALPKRDIRIHRGDRSRQKEIRISRGDLNDLSERIRKLLS